MKSFIRTNKKQFSITALLVVFILVSTIIVFIFIEKKERQNGFDRLIAQSFYADEQFSMFTDGNLYSLKNIARLLSRYIIPTEEGFSYKNSLEDIKNIISFVKIGKKPSSAVRLFLPDGNLVTEKGAFIDISSKIPYNTIVSDKSYMSSKTLDIIDETQEVVYQYYPVMKGEKNVGMLCSVINLNVLTRKAYISVYNDEGYVMFVERKSGDIVLDTWHKSLGSIYKYGIKDTLEKKSFVDVIDDLLAGNTSYIVFESKAVGNNFYFYYSPSKIEDLIRVIIVPEYVVFPTLPAIKLYFIIFAALEWIAFSLYITWILKNTRHQIDLEVGNERNLQLKNRLAFIEALNADFSDIFIYDFEKNTSRILKTNGIIALNVKTRENRYDSLLTDYINQYILKEDAETVREALCSKTITEKLNRNTEYIYIYKKKLKDGIHTIQVKYAKVHSDIESKNLIIAGFKNIDEIVKKENEQHQILQDALAAAKHSNKAKTVFLNNMSHDIRTPMNAIIGFTSMAIAHIDEKELVKNYLSKISVSSKHLISLINDVLDMSRIESGKIRIEEKTEHLPSIFDDLKTIVLSEINNKQLRFFIGTENVINENVICDKLRLNQILLNIISNAVKFTKAGGSVSIRFIQLETMSSGYINYEFRIKDTGIGMSWEFQKHIFEPFERERTATVSGIQGTGLGMAITKNIVDMMGGTIFVKSEEGKGSEFIVTLPFKAYGDSELENAKQDVKTEKLLGKKILFVNSDSNVCMSMNKILNDMGMQSEWTLSGNEAILRSKFAIEQKDDFDFFVIDEDLSDMNGLDVVSQLRKLAGKEPLIIYTVYDNNSINKEARKAGVSDYCFKPLFISELRKVLLETDSNESSFEEEIANEFDFTGKKILLVEDNELNQEIALAILNEAGFIVDVVSDGTEAVAKMQKASASDYDLILMDVQMPKMDGYKATQLIRDLPDEGVANIPIIAMTANAFEEDKQQAFASGMNAHISKPIDVQNLIETLKDIIK